MQAQLPATWVCSQLLTLAGAPDFRHGNWPLRGQLIRTLPNKSSVPSQVYIHSAQICGPRSNFIAHFAHQNRDFRSTANLPTASRVCRGSP